MASCDLRSETAKRDMEKFESSPTPPISPLPTATPVDPADIVKVDTGTEGERISINGIKKKTSAVCSKFNRVLVNGDENEITVRGVCSQLMINGDQNKINVDASAEFVFNGSDNIVQFSRYPNGKEPIVVENRPGNVVEKVSAVTMTNKDSKRKIVE